MLFDQFGKAFHEGSVVKELEWSCINDVSLPSWVQRSGDGSTIDISNPPESRGICTVTTGGDIGASAGIETAFDINTSHFTEIGLFVYGLAGDAGATRDNSSTYIAAGGDSTGAIARNTGVGDDHELVVYPQAGRPLDWLFANDRNVKRRKNMGIIIRPLKKEVWFTSGDPADRASPVIYDMGNWSDITGKLSFGIKALNSEQRSISFAKIKLRLCHY